MILSIITTGRNDNYCGNFTQRIKWQIEKLCQIIKSKDIKDVEITVVDWGSSEKEKLSDVIGLRYDFLNWVYVPENITKEIAGDGFSNSHAWNVGSRKSSGEFYLHTEGDAYITTEAFLRLYEYLKSKSGENLYAWASRYHIPTSIYEDCENLAQIDQQIKIWKDDGKTTWQDLLNFTVYNQIDTENFWGGGVAQLTASKVYNEVTGVAEVFTKWGWMDNDFHRRVTSKYSFTGDLEIILGTEFYAFGHHDIRNGIPWYGHNEQLHCPYIANGPEWGLNNYDLKVYN
jgi:hypothetical protein